MSIMRNGLAAIAMIGTLTATSIVPTQAQPMQYSFGQRDRVITSYCDGHRRDPDCRRYRGGGWGDSDYNNFYSRRRGDLDGIASGLFGFGFGAILGGLLANPNNGGSSPVIGNNSSAHVRACFARYRSYDAGTDSYMGYDGYRHRCSL